MKLNKVDALYYIPNSLLGGQLVEKKHVPLSDAVFCIDWDDLIETVAYVVTTEFTALHKLHA